MFKHAHNVITLELAAHPAKSVVLRDIQDILSRYYLNLLLASADLKEAIQLRKDQGLNLLDSHYSEVIQKSLQTCLSFLEHTFLRPIKCNLRREVFETNLVSFIKLFVKFYEVIKSSLDEVGVALALDDDLVQSHSLLVDSIDLDGRYANTRHGLEVDGRRASRPVA